MFDLLKTAALWVADYMIDDDDDDYNIGKKGEFDTSKKSSKSSSFLDFDFLKSGAKAYVDMTGKSKEPAFQPTPIPRPRSISQLTRGNPSAKYRAPDPIRIGYQNADMRSAMRVLSNPANRQVAQLIPYNMIQPKAKSKATISVGSTTLGNKIT
tara:strand:+ start:680 stop:1141 length:462 start_codon:yes stop_codon:yes gene_type:complete